MSAGKYPAIWRNAGSVMQSFRSMAISWGESKPGPSRKFPNKLRQSRKAVLLAQYRRDMASGRGKGIIPFLHDILLGAWNHALEHPLPTLGYIAVAVAFALERTISTFRLDRILPGASEVFQILRQVF